MKHVLNFKNFKDSGLTSESDYFTGLSKSTIAKKKSQMQRQADMDDDDPEAYKELPGDTKGKSMQKTSVHTKKYHSLYNEGIEYVWEAEDEDKQSTDRSPLEDPAIEKGLKKKSEDTGLSIGIIRAVMRRGLAAWKTGHRPGAGQVQWGYARINSFLTGGEGTWGKADADLADEARKEGFNPKKK